MIVAAQLVSLHFATGCIGAAAPEAAAPPQPPAPAAPAELAPPPPPPPSAPGGAYAPPAAPMEPAPAPAAEEKGKADTSVAATPSAPAAKAAPAKAPPPPVAAKAPPQPAQAKPTAQQATANVPVAPLLIYVGDLQMQVFEDEVATTLDHVIDVAETLGGYLAGRKDTSVQVRIPSQRFRDGLTRIEKLGEVLHRSVTADDVSEQYNDLEVRLVNLKATRQRLQEFLARAGTMADMLQVEQQLQRVAGEIEQIEGKMRFLRSRAAFSLVTVSLTGKPRAIAKVVEPEKPRDVDLPIDWLSRVGLSRLLNLRER